MTSPSPPSTTLKNATRFVDFSDAYYDAQDAFVVAEGFSGTFNQPEDATNYTIGVQTGTTQDAWVTDVLVGGGLMSDTNVFRYDRADQAALDLKNGRIQVLFLDAIPADALARQLGGMVIVYQGVVSSGPMNIVLPEGEKELAEAINSILADLEAEGFIEKLALKYFSGQ